LNEGECVNVQTVGYGGFYTDCSFRYELTGCVDEHFFNTLGVRAPQFYEQPPDCGAPNPTPTPAPAPTPAPLDPIAASGPYAWFKEDGFDLTGLKWPDEANHPSGPHDATLTSRSHMCAANCAPNTNGLQRFVPTNVINQGKPGVVALRGEIGLANPTCGGLPDQGQFDDTYTDGVDFGNVLQPEYTMCSITRYWKKDDYPGSVGPGCRADILNGQTDMCTNSQIGFPVNGWNQGCIRFSYGHFAAVIGINRAGYAIEGPCSWGPNCNIYGSYSDRCWCVGQNGGCVYNHPQAGNNQADDKTFQWLVTCDQNGAPPGEDSQIKIVNNVQFASNTAQDANNKIIEPIHLYINPDYKQNPNKEYPSHFEVVEVITWNKRLSNDEMRAVFKELWVTRMGNENNCDWFDPSNNRNPQQCPGSGVGEHCATCNDFPEEGQCINTFP